MNRAVCDLGNSRVKWGVGRLAATGSDQNWAARGVLDYERLADLPAALRAAGAAPEVLVACVADDGHERQLAALLQEAGFALRRFVPPANCGGLANGYATPAQLGPDRFAAVLGAWRLIGGPALVISAGTATTIDLLTVDDQGPRFAGGVILPGLALMRAALASGTARLPEASGRYAARPDNTDDAIVSGILHAQVGAVERMRRQLPAGSPCLVTGGNAAALLPWIDSPVSTVETLVLDGLLYAAESG